MLAYPSPMYVCIPVDGATTQVHRSLTFEGAPAASVTKTSVISAVLPLANNPTTTLTPVAMSTTTTATSYQPHINPTTAYLATAYFSIAYLAAVYLAAATVTAATVTAA